MELELLEKTEIWVGPLIIREVNLDLVAERVAEVLNLKKKEVMVVDVREDLITLDIMKKRVNAEDIIGKKDVLLRTLAAVPGVSLLPETTLHSEGVLGLIDIEDKKAAEEILGKMEQMGREISERIRKKAIVFASGFEIQKGIIQDINSPHIKKRLTEEGFNVTLGEVLEDDLERIVSALSNAVAKGFGLIVTTGGVGAESKDWMIEALLKLDPEASTRYIIYYERGTGRHVKDGVRIGIAYVKPSFIIALPGPHDEVEVGIEVVVGGLKKGLNKEELAQSLFEKYVHVLRNIHHQP